jgi:hypothetical protein
MAVEGRAAILMPKVARKNLILKSDVSVPLFEYDVKSCMPVILLGLIQDPAERATLTALLDGDIYTAIASECGVTDSRDDIKREFLRFVNGGVHNYVYTFFHQHLPMFAELVLKGKDADKGMAWFGQRVESEIMVQEVPRQLMQTVTAPSSVNQLSNPLTSRGNPDEGILYIPNSLRISLSVNLALMAGKKLSAASLKPSLPNKSSSLSDKVGA